MFHLPNNNADACFQESVSIDQSISPQKIVPDEYLKAPPLESIKGGSATQFLSGVAPMPLYSVLHPKRLCFCNTPCDHSSIIASPKTSSAHLYRSQASVQSSLACFKVDVVF